MKRWIALAVVCILCLGGGCGGGGGDEDKPPAIGEPPDTPDTVTGTVKTAGGAPIAAATVTISTSPAEQTTTGSDGGYGFWVAAGTYTIRAEKTGYQPAEVQVELLSGETETAPDIVLQP
jgi:hypothetical protein